MPHIEQEMRESIAEFLPRAIQAALASYHQFSEAKITDTHSTPTSPEFKAHHEACKVALAHIELLIKLARWADLPDPELEDEVEQRDLRRLIEQAQGELDG